uniref:MIF4G domain-containing protein n=1 Tax=Arcella intermedia TaxID=1963864 RepID=A0A6B2L8I1_9EUKA
MCLYVSSRTPAIHVSSGPPLSFKRLLLERCKEEFETKHHIPEAAPEADIHTKIAVDEARNKLKQRSLGVPKFIGSLFLSGLAPEAIVHCCLVTLLTNPDESDLINFEALMTTIGKRIDQPKAEKLMEAYFAKVEDYSKHPAFSSRIRFKLLDLLDLRKHKWEPKRPLAKPKTIEEVHKDVQEEKEMKIKEMRNLAMRVEEREEDDGWVPPPARGAEGRPPLSALLRKVPSSPPAVPERPAAVPAGLPACRASGRAHPERSAAVPVPATVGRPPNRQQNHHRKHHNYKQNQRTQTHIT